MVVVPPLSNVRWGTHPSTLKSLLALLLILLIVTMSLAKTTEQECILPGDVDVKPKFLYINDKENPITLVTSRRIPHQLLTHAVAIFLRHHLGYVNVVLKYQNGFLPKDVFRGMGVDPDMFIVPEGFLPSALINVEMWTPPKYSSNEYLPLVTDNYLGVVGRLGWFFPFYVVERFSVVDHWRAFTVSNSEAVRVFGRTEAEMAALDSSLRNSSSGDYFCPVPLCHKGVYTPPQCKLRQCAVLFSSYYNESSFLAEHVRNMNMYVKVAWLGPNLDKEFLRRNIQVKGDRSVLFYHFTPDVLLEPFNLTSVAFPSCADHMEYTGMNKLLFCMYEMHRFNKVIWLGLKTSDSYLFKSLERIYISGENYDDLIQEYNLHLDRSIHDTACSWMKMNEPIWRLWRNGDTKPSLYFVGLFPINTTVDKRKFLDPGNVPAFKMAIGDVNANDSILPDHRLSHMVMNTACEPDIVLLEFIRMIQHTTRMGTYSKIIGIVGPACSDTVEPIAGVSKYFKMPIISYGAEGAIFSNREQYPYFFRTIPGNEVFRHVYLQLFKKLKWKRMASLTENGQQYSEYLTPLHDMLQDNGISFNMRKYPQGRKAVNMTQYLVDLKKQSYKIIIGDFYQDVARFVLCEAYYQEMTGHQGYVWFLPRWYSSDWYNVDYWNINSSMPVPCNTNQMIRALQGHMSLSYKFYADDDKLTPSNTTVAQWKKRYREQAENVKVTESDYAGFTYDAVWTYALALDKLFREDHSYTSNLRSKNTTDRFIEYINETNFDGVSGHINFTHGPSRLTDLIIWQFIESSYVEVGRFYPEAGENSFGRLDLRVDMLVWPTKILPKDGSKVCMVEWLRALMGDGVTCNTAIVALCTSSFFTLAVLLIVTVFFLKRRYEAKLRLMEEMWKDQSFFKRFEGWEIERSKVVINRKLGEGQFGAVYGGECLIEPNGWSAVAVKALKKGSTVAEKVDFLLEAEMMKQFNQENIVRLLGVCTEKEPIYTVMEFMLYGDLKTYLLERRNLVNENNRLDDDDEVSNRRLTSMAYDVARAIAYLAEERFVHRDVACRNCLVNAHFSVKLADFGMTRRLNEKNYYRFSRKGMMPIRWMAPESVLEGVFTTSSDIWSYGVLLYEIITFGAFPFQGLSDSQVCDKLKSRQSLPIPAGIQHGLSCLLQACWHPSPTRRLTAAQIMIHLENSPRLITPSLEPPQASLDLESTVELNMRAPERSRRLSLSLSNRAMLSQGMNVGLSVSGNGSGVMNAGGVVVSGSSRRKRSMSGNMIVTLPAFTSSFSEDGVLSSSNLDALNLNQVMLEDGGGRDMGEDPLLPPSQYISTRFMSLSHRDVERGNFRDTYGVKSIPKDMWTNITPV